MTNFRDLIACASIASVALTTTAMAGGFQRGTADTDILYESGQFSMRTGVIYVNPMRGFDSINGQSGDFDDYTGDYNIPSYAVGFGGEAFGCAGTYTESFAADGDYRGSPGGALPLQAADTQSTSNVDRLALGTATVTSRTVGISFDSDEFGMTCRASYASDYGRFSLLGGLFVENFEFQGQSLGQRRLDSAFAGTPVGAALAATGSSLFLPTFADVDVRGEFQTGFRVGAAYEKPEIALRVQVLYRSEVEHDAVSGTGTVTITDTAFVQLANGTTASVPTVFGPAAPLITGALPPAGTVLPATSTLSSVTSPQSLYINAQTGIAEGTLLLAAFRWTDWSTNEAVVSTFTTPNPRGGPPTVSSSYAPYNWRDGYTASIGIGRAFNEQIAGAISIGYDRGVSTGSETTYTDLYTVSGGVSFKANKWSEIRVGGLVGYWTDGAQSISDGAYFNGTVGDDVVLAGNASIKLNF